MKRRYTIGIAFLSISLMGCSAQNVSQAYEIRDEKQKEQVVSSEQETESTTEADQESIDQSIIQEAVNNLGMVDMSYATICQPKQRVSYNGMSMEVDQAVVTESLNSLYDMMEESDATEYMQWLISGGSKHTSFENDGTQHFPDKNCILLIKCKIKNETDMEKRIKITPMIFSIDDENICMDETGIFASFSGEHEPYSNPHIGTTNYDYYNFQPQEEIETIITYEMTIKDSIERKRYSIKNDTVDFYLSTGFINGSFNWETLPVGSQLLPIKLKGKLVGNE